MLLITDGLPRGLGYYEVKHTDAELLPPGLNTTHFEADTYTCTHCNCVVVMNPSRIRERYKCNGCNHHICDNCAAERVAGAACKTMAQKIDEFITAQARQAVADPQIILP